MRTKLFSFCLSAIAALLILCLMPAWAGTMGLLRFNLTEPAVIGASALPPGEYSACLLDTGSDTPVMKLESDAGFSLLIPVMRATLRSEEPSVTLTRQDGTLHVTDFQFSGESYRYAVLTR